MVRIKVPATSANLGVGFDCLGLALEQYAYFDFEEAEELLISGCDPVFQTEDNLIYQAFTYTLEKIGQKSRAIHLNIDSSIPPARGLGSSATCVVGGVLGAFALTKTPVDHYQVLKIATEIEGHPDNVAPALYGGLIASFMGENKIYTQKYDIHDSYRFVVFSPDFETSTKEARERLPEKIAFSHAVANQSKLVFALASLASGDGELLQAVQTDQLHEPYRKVMIHGFDDVAAFAREAGACSVLISGSGPSILAIFQEEVPIEKLRAQVSSLQHGWKCYTVNVDLGGSGTC